MKLFKTPTLFRVIAVVYKYVQHNGSTYHNVTRNSYLSVKYDKGRHLEYLTYRSLRHFENNGGKIFFNVLIPKRNGETTEIDLILICSKGLFVFECKNFSGWIFGDELQKHWTQTLPIGRGRCRKEQFYNPIMQNSSHIRHLKNIIGKNIPIWSVIVFSDRSVFKNVIIRSNVNVINHYRTAAVVANLCIQTQEVYTQLEINDIYNMISRYTQNQS